VDACRRLGADLVFERSPHDWLADARAAVPSGFDTILDVVGGEEVNRNLAAAAPRGRIVQVGAMAGGKVELNIGVLMGKRLGLVGTVLRARPIEEKLVLAQRFAAELLPLFDTGALRPVVDSRFPLEQVADAHRHMEANENVGKIILDVRS
jgi:NADPH:quinone reductase-like Zn-dependent oxidoreductase